MNRLRASCVLAFLALVARSNGSAVNATRPGSAEAAAAAEGRLVFIGNSSYVSRVVMASTCVVESTPCVASCTGIEEDVPLPLAKLVYVRERDRGEWLYRPLLTFSAPGTRHPFSRVRYHSTMDPTRPSLKVTCDSIADCIRINGHARNSCQSQTVPNGTTTATMKMCTCMLYAGVTNTSCVLDAKCVTGPNACLVRGPGKGRLEFTSAL